MKTFLAFRNIYVTVKNEIKEETRLDLRYSQRNFESNFNPLLDINLEMVKNIKRLFRSFRRKVFVNKRKRGESKRESSPGKGNGMEWKGRGCMSCRPRGKRDLEIFLFRLI